MDDKTFKKVLHKCLRELGFSKPSSQYWKSNDEIVFVVGLQKSSFSPIYYINVGFVIRILHPDLDMPRYTDGDVRTRFSCKQGGKSTDVFDPAEFETPCELEQSVKENIADLIGGSEGAQGLKALLARRPTLLYQTTIHAKRALGLDDPS